MKTIHAVYANGVFRPTERVELPEACEVEFEPRAVARPAAMPADSLATPPEAVAAGWDTLDRDDWSYLRDGTR